VSTDNILTWICIELVLLCRWRLLLSLKHFSIRLQGITSLKTYLYNHFCENLIYTISCGYIKRREFIGKLIKKKIVPWNTFVNLFMTLPLTLCWGCWDQGLAPQWMHEGSVMQSYQARMECLILGTLSPQCHYLENRHSYKSIWSKSGKYYIRMFGFRRGVSVK
jgi:hypothetical protein